MPFGQYESFAACVAANRDKDDPEAYCAGLEQEMKAKYFRVIKLVEDRRLVFGWASVAIKDGDTLVTDLQEDQIEPEELEDAAYDFAMHSGLANDMHEGDPVGQMVESFVVTPEKLDKMGLSRRDGPAVAHWVGFRLSPDAFEKVKAGKRTMFSIEGKAQRVPA